MDATTQDRRDEAWEPYAGPEDEQPLPRRPRRQYFNKRSAALLAVVTCAAGFYAGVRVEKGQVSHSSNGITLPGAAATSGSRASAARSTAAGARGGFASLFSGQGGPSGTSLGTISGVKGNTLYVTSASGNVTKVKLSSATKITKSLGVKRKSLHPGDSVVIRGVQKSGGTLVAASVSDSGSGGGALSALGGFGGGGGGGGGSSSTGSTGSGSSGVSSLFSSGDSGG